MTLGDVAGKWALLPAGLAAVMIGRGVAGGLTVASLALIEGDWRRLLPVRWRAVLVRSVLHSAVSLTWYMAWQVIPLADAYAIGFTAPLLMTLLAVPMLGEVIRWRRMLSTLIGFSGVLLMVQPGSALWNPILLVMIPGIVGMAITRIMTRQLSTTETAECLSFWLLVAHIPAGGLLLLGGTPPLHAMAPEIWAALALLGVFNGLAHWMMARAYALAPVAALAPYEYTMLIWGGIAGFVVFHEVPGWSTLAGAAVVAAAGLYNLHRERVRRAAAR
ncbi:MAG: DMT family transporter [Gemmatimonadaceae bacterium]|nr:DMT family transporter [Acetobacteraceae bacterium]